MLFRSVELSPKFHSYFSAKLPSKVNSAINTVLEFLTKQWDSILANLKLSGYVLGGSLLVYATKGFVFNSMINLYDTLQVYYNNPKKYLNSICIIRDGKFRRARACPCWTLRTLAKRMGGTNLFFKDNKTSSIKQIENLNDTLLNFLKFKRNEKVSVCFFVE